MYLISEIKLNKIKQIDHRKLGSNKFHLKKKDIFLICCGKEKTICFFDAHYNKINDLSECEN